MERVEDLLRLVTTRTAGRDMVTQRIEATEAEIDNLRATVETLEKIHGVVTHYAQTYQENFLRQIEDVVTKGLEAIFEDSMRFKVEQVVSGKRLEVRFTLVTEHKGETLETSIMESRGGGVGAVVGFLLRVAVLLLIPNQRKLLVLDETFAQLSVEYLSNLSEFIRQLCDQTGIQVIMVTHSPELTQDADVVYSVSNMQGSTIFTREV